MSIIASKIKELLQQDGYNPTISPDDEDLIFLPTLNGTNGQFNTMFIGKDPSKESDAIIIAQTECPVKIPLSKREKILKFLNEMNRSWFSSLAVNMETGTLFCRTSNRSTPSEAMNVNILRPVLFSTMGRLDILQPTILELIYTEKTTDDILNEMKQATSK
jgi:hypothetical protein